MLQNIAPRSVQLGEERVWMSRLAHPDFGQHHGKVVAED